MCLNREIFKLIWSTYAFGTEVANESQAAVHELQVPWRNVILTHWLLMVL